MKHAAILKETATAEPEMKQECVQREQTTEAPVETRKHDSVIHKTPPFYALVNAIKKKTLVPGNYYGEPGQGDSRIVSVIASVFFIALWALVTEMGWVKPLFLPAPSAVVERFGDLVVNGFSGVSLTDGFAMLVTIEGCEGGMKQTRFLTHTLRSHSGVNPFLASSTFCCFSVFTN